MICQRSWITRVSMTQYCLELHRQHHSSCSAWFFHPYVQTTSVIFSLCILSSLQSLATSSGHCSSGQQPCWEKAWAAKDRKPCFPIHIVLAMSYTTLTAVSQGRLEAKHAACLAGPEERLHADHCSTLGRKYWIQIVPTVSSEVH